MINRLLGVIALAGAPAMLIGLMVEKQLPALAYSWWTGAWGIVYITAWMGSIIALLRLEATGKSAFGKALLWLILSTLTIANISSVYQLQLGKNTPLYFLLLDMFWPISNIIMLLVGISVLVNKGLPGWKRYVPLAVGLWLPITAVASKHFADPMEGFGGSSPAFYISLMYSAIAWMLLGFAVLSTPEKHCASSYNTPALKNAQQSYA